ncbi:MAG: HNH endonuclease [Actinobacteria bacterium]|nr:HNH endonuclease [Actinomycetota bacterium]
MIVSASTQSGKPIEECSKWSVEEKVLVRCDVCGEERWLSYAVASNNLNRTGTNRCKSCALKGIEKPNLRGKPVYTASGKDHHAWKGGSYVSGDGYRMVWCGARNHRREHTVVMEEYLGRALEKSEVVHHLDGDKLNNSVDNLVVLQKSSHHRTTHQSLQEVGYSLVKAGLIGFDRTTNQYVAHDKLRELLGHLEAGNQQPSPGSDTSEGSETRGEAHAANNSPKSAGHSTE